MYGFMISLIDVYILLNYNKVNVISDNINHHKNKNDLGKLFTALFQNKSNDYWGKLNRRFEQGVKQIEFIFEQNKRRKL